MCWVKFSWMGMLGFSSAPPCPPSVPEPIPEVSRAPQWRERQRTIFKKTSKRDDSYEGISKKVRDDLSLLALCPDQMELRAIGMYLVGTVLPNHRTAFTKCPVTSAFPKKGHRAVCIHWEVLSRAHAHPFMKPRGRIMFQSVRLDKSPLFLKNFTAHGQ